ncbi:hypothetical protein HDU76_006129, partial [Blyttiomyces sp. JEL0837]
MSAPPPPPPPPLNNSDEWPQSSAYSPGTTLNDPDSGNVPLPNDNINQAEMESSDVDKSLKIRKRQSFDANRHKNYTSKWVNAVANSNGEGGDNPASRKSSMSGAAGAKKYSPNSMGPTSAPVETIVQIQQAGVAPNGVRTSVGMRFQEKEKKLDVYENPKVLKSALADDSVSEFSEGGFSRVFNHDKPVKKHDDEEVDEIDDDEEKARSVAL